MVNERTKSLGRYYTPGWLAQELVDWALPHAGRVLDPSFGGCSFLSAALRRLESQTSTRPGRYVFGVDIDRQATAHARSIISRGVPPENILIANFLTSRTIESLGRFEAVVGNPPYIRHQTLSEQQIREAQGAISHAGITLPRLASAWAYFAILAATLVAEDGRMALILPGALLHTNYASAVLQYIENAFEAIRLAHIKERIFEGTDEESVILLACGKGRRPRARLQYDRMSAHSLRAYLRDPAETRATSVDGYKLSLLSDRVVQAWHAVRSRLREASLGEIADLRIGVVTGANDFFVRPATDPLVRLKDVDAVPIVSRSRYLTAPVFSRAAMSALHKAGRPSELLLIKGRGRPRSGLRRELERAEVLGISARYHCSRRDPWYEITDLDVADAFLPYCNSGPPHVTQNAARAQCTNTIHRLWADRQAIEHIVTSSYTSLFSFECELFGRHYGGSVLKLEPSEAQSLSVTTQLNVFQTLASSGTRDEAREVADHAAIKVYRLDRAWIEDLRHGAAILRAHRGRLRLSVADNCEHDSSGPVAQLGTLIPTEPA
jgi:adenine-specific DNA-methyltransferase